jgi:hypothetical protein
MSDEYKRYMSMEWGWEKRGDVPLFEKLCLEGAQVERTLAASRLGCASPPGAALCVSWLVH